MKNCKRAFNFPVVGNWKRAFQSDSFFLKCHFLFTFLDYMKIFFDFQSVNYEKNFLVIYILLVFHFQCLFLIDKI